CLSALTAFIEYELVGNYLTTLFIIFSSHRTVLIFCSMIIILIPIGKNLCQPKTKNNSHPSSDTSLKKQKAERQLLYETIFVCFWKGVNNVTDSVYQLILITRFRGYLLTFVMDSSVFLSN